MANGNLPADTGDATLYSRVPLAVPAVPLGVDLAFDFGTGDLLTTPRGDLRTVSGKDTLAQWCMAVLQVDPGQNLLYEAEFGSLTLREIGDGISQEEAEVVIPQRIEEALMSHDRIHHVEFDNVTQIDDETLLVSFTVVMDTDERLIFTDVEVG